MKEPKTVYEKIKAEKVSADILFELKEIKKLLVQLYELKKKRINPNRQLRPKGEICGGFLGQFEP